MPKITNLKVFKRQTNNSTFEQKFNSKKKKYRIVKKLNKFLTLIFT